MSDDHEGGRPPAGSPSEQDVDEVLREFGDDPRRAILALLHDLQALAEDFEASVSYGFVRGGIPRLELKSRKS